MNPTCRRYGHDFLNLGRGSGQRAGRLRVEQFRRPLEWIARLRRRDRRSRSRGHSFGIGGWGRVERDKDGILDAFFNREIGEGIFGSSDGRECEKGQGFR